MTTLFRPATWNPSDKGTSCTLSNGDLTCTGNQTGVRSTKSVTTGKWYVEATSASRLPIIGVATAGAALTNFPGSDAYGWAFYGYSGDPKKYTGGTPTTYGATWTYGGGEVLGIAIDGDNHTIEIFIANVSQGVMYTGLGTNLYLMTGGDSNGAASDVTVNFGASAFTYSPPTGFYAGFGDIVDVSEGTAYATLPMLTALMGTPPPVFIDLPSLEVTILGGANATAALPMLGVSMTLGGEARLSLPSLEAAASGHERVDEYFSEITLPALTASAYSGATASVTLGNLSFEATGIGTVWGDMAASLPSLAITADGRASEVASADITMPSLTAQAYSGAVCSITIGGITTTASGTTGAIGGVVATLPLFEVAAIATMNGMATAAISLPMFNMSTGERIAAMLPSLNFVAIGTATVTATYEAYAINLKHTGDKPVDEVTRYTNFPFTHIVRYQNSYYGANENGLFLLEGTTDYAATPTAIPWAFKTAVTDFGYPEFKTIESAYIGGRLGPSETLTLHAGEGKQTQAYSYTTPRGELAQNYRQKFGKGIKNHRYYALGANGSGEMVIDSIDFNVAKLSRRI